MTKQKKYGGLTVYTLNCNVSASLHNGKIKGSIDIENYSSIPITGDIMFEFKADVYRLMHHSGELVKEDEPWLIQLQPVSPSNKLFMLSIGGEYIDDINLSNLKSLLEKVIFIN